MRVVLYANDMEPITVINLFSGAERYLKKNGQVRLPVPPLFGLKHIPIEVHVYEPLKVVTIFAEMFIRRGCEHMMLFTPNEEEALLLKCAFLPGQMAGLQERERMAFAGGILDALTRIGGA